MNPTDAQLLDQWQKRRDADAFAELVSRHADMVYATCLRVLRDAGDAEDAAQECFVVLMKSRPAVGTSLAPWLHTVARRRALDIVRGKKRREQRELENAVDLTVSANRDTMDLLAWTDEVIAELPELLRVPVVERFLMGRKHGEIAADLGISEAAVRHRIGKGVEQIREALRRRGVTITAVALMTMLGTEFAVAAPLALKAGLGKLAIASPTATIAPVWAAAEGLVAVKKIGVALGVLIGVLIAGLLAFKAGDHQDDSEIVVGEVSEAAVVETAVRNAGPPEGAALPATVVDTPEIENALPEAGRVLEPCEIADPANYASVSGHVRTEAGDPVAGAEVLLVAQGYEADEEVPAVKTQEWVERAMRRNHHFQTTSGADGAYRITGIRFRGHAHAHASLRDGATANGAKGTLLVEGQSVDGVDIVVRASALIHGRVISASGAPVTDAVIRPIDGRGGLAHTDDRGLFEIACGGPGTASNRITVTSQIYGTATFTDVAMNTPSLIEFKMPGAAVLRGKVTWRGTAPPAGMHVHLSGCIVDEWETQEDGSTRPLSSWLDMSYTGSIAGDGRYEIAGIDSGQYYHKVTVEDETGVQYTEDSLGFLPPNHVSAWNPVVADLGEVYGTVRGEVTGRPLQNGKIMVWALYEGREVERKYAEKDGAYQFRLPARSESYLIGAAFDYFGSNVFAEYGQEINVAPGTKSLLDLVFIEPFTLSVRVVNEEGTAMSGVGILQREMNSERRVGQTDGEGRFTWAGMMPGFGSVNIISVLAARHPGYAESTSSLREGESGAVYPEETIVLYRTASVTGRIVDVDGSPLSDSNVYLEIPYGDERVTRVTLHTNNEGVFSSADNVPATLVGFTVTIQHGGAVSQSLQIEPQVITSGGTADLGELVFEPSVEAEGDDVGEAGTE